jgi:hypothetical protein
MRTDDYSEKRERNIRYKRLPNVMHTKLLKVKKQNRCRSIFDALLYCAERWLESHDNDGHFNATNAHKSTLPEGRVN